MARLNVEDREAVKRDVLLGISLSFTCNNWGVTEGTALRHAGITREEWERRHQIRIEMLPVAGDADALNRAVLAAVAEPEGER